MRFKIDWASLTVGSKFTGFGLFYFVLEGRFNGRVFGVTGLGGSYLEGFIHGGANFPNFTVFSLNVCKAALQAASAYKRREFWRKTHTPLRLLIGRIIFLTREKTSFAILIGRIIFFTCENHCSLL